MEAIEAPGFPILSNPAPVLSSEHIVASSTLSNNNFMSKYSSSSEDESSESDSDSELENNPNNKYGSNYGGVKSSSTGKSCAGKRPPSASSSGKTPFLAGKGGKGKSLYFQQLQSQQSADEDENEDEIVYEQEDQNQQDLEKQHNNNHGLMQQYEDNESRGNNEESTVYSTNTGVSENPTNPFSRDYLQGRAYCHIIKAVTDPNHYLLRALTRFSADVAKSETDNLINLVHNPVGRTRQKQELEDEKESLKQSLDAIAEKSVIVSNQPKKKSAFSVFYTRLRKEWKLHECEPTDIGGMKLKIYIELLWSRKSDEEKELFIDSKSLPGEDVRLASLPAGVEIPQKIVEQIKAANAAAARLANRENEKPVVIKQEGTATQEAEAITAVIKKKPPRLLGNRNSASNSTKHKKKMVRIRKAAAKATLVRHQKASGIDDHLLLALGSHNNTNNPMSTLSAVMRGRGTGPEKAQELSEESSEENSTNENQV